MTGQGRSALGLALALWVASSGVYGLLAWDRLGGPSTDPHFILQAEAFLHGSLELVRRPPHRNDWASYRVLTLRDGREVSGIYLTPGTGGQARRFRTLEGETILVEPGDVVSSKTRVFVSFPSFPAVVMTPFVALLGTGFSDVAFTVVVAGLDVALMFLFLERLVALGRSRRTRRENLGLALVFGFGTVHLWCSVLGQVWFTALVMGVGLGTGYLMAALDARHPWLAGLLLGLGMATRTPLAFAAPFFLLELWARGDLGLRSRLETLLKFSAPVLVIGGLLMAMNVARFHRPFEFGHTYLAGGSIERIKYYGLFGLRFLPRNLVAALLLLPTISTSYPYMKVSRHGMSLLLTTPVFGYLFAATRPLPPTFKRLGLTAAMVAVPLLLYQNTGYVQFGYRFSLDFTPELMGMLAVGLARLSPRFWALAGLGVLVNGFGAVTFERFDVFYDDHFPSLRWLGSLAPWR